MYESYFLEPHEISDILEEINESKKKIVSVVHLSESQQLLIICEVDEAKKGILGLLGKEEEIEE